MPTRRQLLTTTAAGLAAAVGVSSTAGATTDAETDDWEHKPSHITYSYDQQELEAYQPKFITSRDARSKITGLFGFKAESTNWSRDAYYYWMRYTHQDSASDSVDAFGVLTDVLGPDSHLYDREPSIVFVDDDGVPTQAVVTGYHHYALEIPYEPDEFLWTEDRLDGTASHVHLRVIDPWHHYRYVEADSEDRGTLLESVFDVRNWLEVRDAWRDNGFYNNSHGPAIEDPFVMLDRESWWADGTWDQRFGKLWIRMGLGGARESDDLRTDVDDRRH